MTGGAGVRAGAGFSPQPDARRAGEEVAEAALAGAVRADSALLFATPGHVGGPEALLDAVCGALGTEAVVGAAGHGVLAAGQELEGAPGVALLVQSGVETLDFLLPDLPGDEALVGERIAARLGGPPRPEDLVVLLPDLSGADPEPLLHGLRSALPPARVVGAGAGDPLARGPLVWRGRQLARDGLAGVVLRGAQAPRIGLTQACRPVTGPLTVTRAQGNWIVELDGRRALDVYMEVARSPLAGDLRRAAAFVLVAVPGRADASFEPGDYKVRNVVGFAVEHGAFATPEQLKPGQAVALVVREPETARDDLKAMLGDLARSPAALGLYFNCCARGSSFFGVEGLESAYLESTLGALPLAGIFGSCEIGPIAGDRSELLTYTGLLALVDG